MRPLTKTPVCRRAYARTRLPSFWSTWMKGKLCTAPRQGRLPELQHTAGAHIVVGDVETAAIPLPILLVVCDFRHRYVCKNIQERILLVVHTYKHCSGTLLAQLEVRKRLHSSNRFFACAAPHINGYNWICIFANSSSLFLLLATSVLCSSQLSMCVNMYGYIHYWRKCR